PDPSAGRIRSQEAARCRAARRLITHLGGLVMFGWLTRTRIQAPQVRRRRTVPLMLERLETRDCPSGGDLLIMSLNVSALNVGKQVQVSGTVEDGDPTANVCLNFSGVVSG